MPLQVTNVCPLIQVYDMPEALRFYCDGLGFECVESSPVIDAPEGPHFQWARLRLGRAALMLNTAYNVGERPTVRDLARHAAHRDMGLYFDCPDVDLACAEVRKKGLRAKGPQNAPYGMRQLWLRDPDGYELCFQTPI